MDFTLVYEYLEKYQAWWLEEFEQKPTRVFIETFLLIFIIYLLFKRPTNKKAESKLTTREVEDLLNEWEPEPLVNMDDASLIAGGISDSVVIKQKLGSTVVTEHDDILVDFVSFDFVSFDVVC